MAKSKRRIRKYLYIIIPIIIIALVVYLTIRKKSDTLKDKKDIETYKVTKGRVEATLSTTGAVKLQKTVKVKSDISGKVKKLFFEDGDKVEKGQVLATIEPDKYELLNLYGKRANVQNTLINLEDARANLKKKKEIYEKIKGSSLDELEKLERNLHAAETNYSLALLELKVYEEKLNIIESKKNIDILEAFDGEKVKGFDDFNVTAPLSGIVVQKSTEEGELVVSGISSNIEGTTLCVIGDPSEIIISCNVNEIDIPKIKVDYPVLITFDGLPNDKMNGRIKRIATVGQFQQDRGIVTFPVEIEILEKETRLKPGMTTDIKVSMEAKDDILQVPFESIFEEKDKNYLYVKKDNKFDKQEIKLGFEGTDNVEILSGVEEGTLICKNVEDMQEKKDDKKKSDEDRRHQRNRNNNDVDKG